MSYQQMNYLQTDFIGIKRRDLNPREQKVLDALRARPRHVRDLARVAFPGQRNRPGTYGRARGGGTDRAYRCVLNALRRLVAGGFARRAAPGEYARL